MALTKRQHSLIILGLILTLTLGPMFYAWYLYKQDIPPSDSTVHHGQLIDPPIFWAELPDTLQRKWVLGFAAPENCQDSCMQRIYDIHQVHRATGKHQARIKRAILSANTDTADFDTIFKRFPEITLLNNKQAPLAIQPAWIYLIDPMGNVMMSYDQDVKASDILKDLERLLKVSKIG